MSLRNPPVLSIQSPRPADFLSCLLFSLSTILSLYSLSSLFCSCAISFLSASSRSSLIESFTARAPAYKPPAAAVIGISPSTAFLTALSSTLAFFLISRVLRFSRASVSLIELSGSVNGTIPFNLDSIASFCFLSNFSFCFCADMCLMSAPNPSIAPPLNSAFQTARFTRGSFESFIGVFGVKSAAVENGSMRVSASFSSNAACLFR